MALIVHWMALGKRLLRSTSSYFMVFQNAHPHLNKNGHLLILDNAYAQDAAVVCIGCIANAKLLGTGIQLTAVLCLRTRARFCLMALALVLPLCCTSYMSPFEASAEVGLNSPADSCSLSQIMAHSLSPIVFVSTPLSFSHSTVANIACVSLWPDVFDWSCIHARSYAQTPQANPWTGSLRTAQPNA